VSEIKNDSERLKRRVDQLESSVVHFKKLRHRFLSLYKRDVLGDENDADSAFIRGGTVTASPMGATANRTLFCTSHLAALTSVFLSICMAFTLVF
jgi:hypothetical protein